VITVLKRLTESVAHALKAVALAAMDSE